MLQKLPVHKEGAIDLMTSTPKLKSPSVDIPSTGGAKLDLLQKMMYEDMLTSKELPKKLGGTSHIVSMSGLDDAKFMGDSEDDKGMREYSYTEMFDAKKSTCVNPADEVDMQAEQKNVLAIPTHASSNYLQKDSKGNSWNSWEKFPSL